MKQILIVFLAFFLLIPFHSALADTVDKKVTLYFFWQKGCSRCVHEKNFLSQIRDKYPYLQIEEFEISENEENDNLLKTMSAKLHFQISAIPVTIIHQRHFIGFRDEETTGKEIEIAIIEEHENRSTRHRETEQLVNSNQENTLPETLSIPIFNQIKIKDLSLPVLSIVLGAIDGFNPCAMWVLVMLLSFLIGIHDRKKLIILGSLFLLASTFVYFMFLVAWLNLMLFISYIPLVKISIGVIATLGGLYYLREFWKNKDGVCKVTGSKQKRIISQKIEHFIQEKHFILAACAVIILAFLVNLIELVCSAGIPAIYTQVLALTPLSTAEYYFQIIIYLFFFMLDDLIVFLVAIFSLHMMNLTGKYTRYSHLIGGSLLILIGLALIFKPEWLMFG
jgi:hypothetical protein